MFRCSSPSLADSFDWADCLGVVAATAAVINTEHSLQPPPVSCRPQGSAWSGIEMRGERESQLGLHSNRSWSDLVRAE